MRSTLTLSEKNRYISRQRLWFFLLLNCFVVKQHSKLLVTNTGYHKHVFTARDPRTADNGNAMILKFINCYALSSIDLAETFLLELNYIRQLNSPEVDGDCGGIVPVGKYHLPLPEECRRQPPFHCTPCLGEGCRGARWRP